MVEVFNLVPEHGRRLRLRQSFPAALCASGPDESLAALQRFLSARFPRLVFRIEIVVGN